MVEMVVYGLHDPRYPEVTRYVGQTKNIRKRLKLHLIESRYRGAKNLWIREIGLDEGVRPSHSILETVRSLDVRECRRLAIDAESRWIKRMADYGHPILNAPHWKRAMLAEGIPRSTIEIYSELTATYYSRRSTRDERCWAHRMLIEIQRDFPQLFFRRHFSLEKLIFKLDKCVIRSYNLFR